MSVADEKYRAYVNKFGENLSIATTTDPESVWSRGGLYPWPTWTTNQAFTVVSTDPNDTAAGTGMQKVRVEGVDSDYKPVYAEVELAGATPVPIGNFYRVFRMYGIRAGTGGVNAGTVTADTGATAYAEIAAGQGQTVMAIYTVPDVGTPVSMLGWWFTVARSVTAWAEVEILFRVPGGVWRVIEVGGAVTTGSSAMHRDLYKHPYQIPAGTDIEMRVVEVSGTVDVNGGFDLGIHKIIDFVDDEYNIHTADVTP
jgi:hypothetical protein